jgi:type II secretory ATPase GspE/PulE/Tfp pilus assembly ATPase PilB-like protein
VLTSENTGAAAPADQDLIALLLDLKSISLDEQIFSDPAFQSLSDFSQDLVAEPFLIASVLDAIVAQRILRRVCTYCKAEYTPDQPVQDDIKQVLGPLLPLKYKDAPITLTKGNGCEECQNSGYLGRVGIYEVLKVTKTLHTLIFKSAPADEIFAQAISEGFITMKQDGYLKALEGTTTIEEIIRSAEM